MILDFLMPFGRRAALCLASSLLAAEGNAQPNVGGAAGQSACTIREQSRSPLTIDGTREMYVEPSAVIASGGEVLLAGSPNYLHAPGGPHEPRGFVQDSVLGAVIDAAGRGRLVPAPIDPTRIIDVRGLARAGGGWALTFAELKQPWRPPAPDTVVRYWYGEYDGRTWTRLDSLPIPPEGQLRTAGASSLLVRGDTTFFAVRVMEPHGRVSIALYRRMQGTWTLTRLPGNGAAYAALTYSDSTGLVIGMIRPDRSLAYDVNSFFLHAGAAWENGRKVIAGAPEPVYEPVFSSSPVGPVLTWFALSRGRRHARAMIGALTSNASVVPLDSATQGIRHLDGLRAAPIWLSAGATPEGGSELRFLAPGQQRAAMVVARFPSPYTGWFGTTATTPDDVLISGPLLRRESPNPSLVTLLIRVRVDCAVRAPRSDGSTLARRAYVHPPPGGLDDFPHSIRNARPVRAALPRLRR